MALVKLLSCLKVIIWSILITEWILLSTKVRVIVVKAGENVVEIVLLRLLCLSLVSDSLK